MEKYKGYIRMKYYFSDDKKRAWKIEDFDCKNCVEKGYRKLRKCGKSDADLNFLVGEEKVKQEVKINRPTLRKRRIYSATKPSEKKIQRHKNRGMVMEGFVFKECPISWIDDSIKKWADVLYDCAKSDMTFFSGGVSDQPNKLWMAKTIVQSESNKIEGERMKRK